MNKDNNKDKNKELDRASIPLSKKIRKVVEETIIQNHEEFVRKFGEAEMNDALKHKAQIGKIAVEDSILEDLIKDEVEDCIGVYLMKKSHKKIK